MAKQQKKLGRDTPLAPTPAPTARDASSVGRFADKGKDLYPLPDFRYKRGDYSKKDSADYRKGHDYGIKEVSRNPEAKDRFLHSNGYQKGRDVTGLNDKFNEGFSEGKDKVLDKKAKKK
jgi:hypothetical protein